jgi:hypothetical protein
MTHPMQTTALDTITELLAEHGFDGLAQAVTVLLNEAMKTERAHAAGAGPYERTDAASWFSLHHPAVFHQRFLQNASPYPARRDPPGDEL